MTMQPTRFIDGAITFHVALIRMMTEKIPSEVHQDIRYGRTLNLTHLVVQTEGPHFSFGSDLREWTDKDVNWFRTFIAEVNLSYRAIEALKVPTIATFGATISDAAAACKQSLS